MEALCQWSVMTLHDFSMELWQRLRPLFAQTEKLQACVAPLGERIHIFAPYSPVGPITINCLRIPLNANGYFLKRCAN